MSTASSLGQAARVSRQQQVDVLSSCNGNSTPTFLAGQSPHSINTGGVHAQQHTLTISICLLLSALCAVQVKSIILCGHYNCGAVRAALQLPHCTPSLVNCWISDIRECRNQAERELIDLDPEQQLAR